LQNRQVDSQVRIKQKENILAAAELCFVNQGIALTTMSDITKRAGIYRRTLYNYFNCKEEIASEIFHRYSQENLQLDLPYGLSGYELMEHVLVKWLKQIEKYQPYILFAIEFEYHFHKVGKNREYLESGINFHIICLIETILKKGIEDGSITLPEGDFNMIVQSLLHTLIAYLFRVIHREDVFIMESGFSMEYFDLSLKIILRGLKT
jgi:AcrR family transcriptional regulator